jgi:tetratricopeptide (TPR) repeat protein
MVGRLRRATTTKTRHGRWRCANRTGLQRRCRYWKAFTSPILRTPLSFEKLATALVAAAVTETDAGTRAKTFLRARSLVLKAKELGDESNLVQVLLERIPADGKVGEAKFSEHKEADEAMKEAEGAFARGDFGAAIAGYQRALAADPKLYEAALFMADVYFQTKQLEKAGEAYAKAIEINPNRETAYRYWADVLTKSGRLAEARLKLIEALVAEPYNKDVYRGVAQWAQVAGVRPAHPQIELPEFKRESSGNKTTIDIAVNANETDGSSALMWYGIARATWTDGKSFAKAYPAEKNYRHSLAEETEALRAVIEALANQEKAGRIKSLSPQLATLKKLGQAGLLEAYVLFARVDDGIAQDYAAYRATHRDKIRQYLNDNVMPAAR